MPQHMEKTTEKLNYMEDSSPKFDRGKPNLTIAKLTNGTRRYLFLHILSHQVPTHSVPISSFHPLLFCNFRAVADKIAVLSIGVERWSAFELAALYSEGEMVLHGDVGVSFQPNPFTFEF